MFQIEYPEKIESRVLWDELQHNWRCCGVTDGVADWAHYLGPNQIPASCLDPRRGCIIQSTYECTYSTSCSEAMTTSTWLYVKLVKYSLVLQIVIYALLVVWSCFVLLGALIMHKLFSVLILLIVKSFKALLGSKRAKKN